MLHREGVIMLHFISGRPWPAGRLAPLVAATGLALAAAGCGEGGGLTALGQPGLVPEGDDGPQILAVDLPAETFPEALLAVEVRASGVNDIVQVDIGLRDAVVRDTTIDVDPPATAVTVNALFEMPLTVADSVLGVEVSAIDALGARSEVFIDSVRVRSQEESPVGGG